MSRSALPFPEPTSKVAGTREVLLGYLDYFRSVVVTRVGDLDEATARASSLPSGWSPLELVNHLVHVERRWLTWGFEGQPVDEPWGDTRDGRWAVAADASLVDVLGALRERADETRRTVLAHDLDEVGQPSERWAGEPPATLGRVLLHLLQEYARHVGHLDVVRELLDGETGGVMDSVAAATTPAAVATKGLAVPPVTRYAVVGAGWRAAVFLRMAYLMPERFEVTGVVTRRAETGAELEAAWGVPTYRDVESLLAADRPDVVVLSVPWPVTPELTRLLVAKGVPVLAETPPAPDAAGLRSLWHDVGASGLVQVAEQYPLMPLHAARLEVVRSGLIGSPSSVLVSSTHGYHAVALMRGLLGVGREGVTVRGQAFTAELVDPITPAGWTHDREPKPARTVLASLDFGEGRMGRYDFTDNQWWNPLRPDHLVVRGSAGEIWDETVVRMVDGVTPMTSRIERASTGVGMNYEGLDLTHLSLDGCVVFRNAFEGARLSDDDIGVASLLAQTGAWVRGEGEPPYPLAEACHDHLIGLAIDEAVASGERVRVEPDAWS